MSESVGKSPKKVTARIESGDGALVVEGLFRWVLIHFPGNLNDKSRESSSVRGFLVLARLACASQ